MGVDELISEDLAERSHVVSGHSRGPFLLGGLNVGIAGEGCRSQAKSKNDHAHELECIRLAECTNRYRLIGFLTETKDPTYRY